MSLYKQLHTQQIQIAGNAVLEQDFGESAILVPSPNCKVFLHWLTEKGNIRSTFTMTYATKVSGRVRITNGLNSELTIQVLTNW
jgi:hypothetical protein